eukprot:CAMPEP_0202061572 /NCGR_PEP_ID=MMETSP0963-20130614/41557_1 /ASSEMBLY_ACC=CAM_ASM_000494 /TAXON_ID=4773 /ORGANISM="Schizochytrium aggregatum, Strain ATCC28209" /LENGTH=58 /DNA_ID=CAMNT_0048627801 /DNA_START=24 /DNA_END=197 /DNA_ORIENTATION=+
MGYCLSTSHRTGELLDEASRERATEEEGEGGGTKSRNLLITTGLRFACCAKAIRMMYG